MRLPELVLSVYGEKRACGRKHKSEEKLRRTVRRYGELMGTAELEAHQKRGFKPNLLNFYTKSRYHCEDPRLVCECQRLNEQTALFNVVRCPFAHCAALYNMQKEAKIFCEEYTAACIEAYTGKVAQVERLRSAY